MSLADVRTALTSKAWPGTRRFWWVVAEIISVAHEGIERIAYELDHWANIAMSKSEQFDGPENGHHPDELPTGASFGFNVPERP